MSVHIKPCSRCRSARRERRATDKRSRKACPDCKWIAITPPALGRKSLGTFATKADAEAAFQQAMVNRRNGIAPLPQNLTVENVIERFLDQGTREVTVTTRNRYRELWRLHASPLASLPIAKLRKTHIAELYGTLAQKLAGRTVLYVHRFLHCAFHWAVRNDVLAVNIFASVQAPKAKPSEARALTQDEAQRFFAGAAETAFEDFFHIAVLTGARRGELAALRWQSVDLDAKRIAIREARASTRSKKADRAGGMASEVTKAPKSHKARTIPLDDAAVLVFRRIRAKQAAEKLRIGGTYQDGGYVFATALGEPCCLNSATKAFREVADRVGLDRALSLHSLRHTAATWALARGADVIAVQHILGHAAASTTLGIYGHVVAGAKERAVGSVAAALRAAQSRTAESR